MALGIEDGISKVMLIFVTPPAKVAPSSYKIKMFNNN